MTTKSFSFATAGPSDEIVIDLDGVPIRCRPVISGLVLMEFTGSTASSLEFADVDEADIEKMSDAERRKRAAAAGRSASSLYKVLQAAIVPEDWSLFEQTLQDKNVPLDGLIEITNWLIEQYSGNPTQSQ